MTGLVIIGVLLTGCSVWPHGEDPNALEYRRAANQVMIAIQHYRQDKGDYPQTLATLTPVYIPALPDTPDLRYEPADGSMTFAYRESWPQLHHVTCHSRGATTDWNCK